MQKFSFVRLADRRHSAEVEPFLGYPNLSICLELAVLLHYW